MTTANMNDPAAMTGAPVEGTGRVRLGKVDSIYLDNVSGRPEWAAVKSGLFGGRISLVPLRRGEWDGTVLRVPFDKKQLSGAPHHDPDTGISVRDEQKLYRHYRIDDEGDHRGRWREADAWDEIGSPGRDTSGRDVDQR